MSLGFVTTPFQRIMLNRRLTSFHFFSVRRMKLTEAGDLTFLVRKVVSIYTDSIKINLENQLSSISLDSKSKNANYRSSFFSSGNNDIHHVMRINKIVHCITVILNLFLQIYFTFLIWNLYTCRISTLEQRTIFRQVTIFRHLFSVSGNFFIFHRNTFLPFMPMKFKWVCIRRLK